MIAHCYPRRDRPDVLCGGVMIRLDLSYFYRLALTLQSVKIARADHPVRDAWPLLWQAAQSIDQLFQDPTVGTTFRRAASTANELYSLLTEQTRRPWEEDYTAYDKARVEGLLDRFTTLLQAELAVADAYFVVQKRGLDTVALVSAGEVLFPPSLASKVPEAVADLREAGKCIAFELCTAAGFHLVRAVETVLRRYWEVETGNAPKPRQRNIGTYIRGLEGLNKGDEKILAALRQFKDLHRNVLTHTEVFLDTDKALSLLGIARSVVDAMLDQIPDKGGEAPAPDEQSFPPLTPGAEALLNPESGYTGDEA